MPIYTYACTNCNAMVEKRQSFSDAPLTTCDECGGSLRKVIHPVGIVFKGSGWYVTDSRKATSSSVGESGEKSDTKSAETSTKPATESSSASGSSSGSEKKPAASAAAD